MRRGPASIQAPHALAHFPTVTCLPTPAASALTSSARSLLFQKHWLPHEDDQWGHHPSTLDAEFGENEPPWLGTGTLRGKTPWPHPHAAHAEREKHRSSDPGSQDTTRGAPSHGPVLQLPCCSLKEMGRWLTDGGLSWTLNGALKRCEECYYNQKPDSMLGYPAPSSQMPTIHDPYKARLNRLSRCTDLSGAQFSLQPNCKWSSKHTGVCMSVHSTHTNLCTCTAQICAHTTVRTRRHMEA